ncbi:BnaCnng67540D, partial [Brassica napus]
MASSVTPVVNAAVGNPTFDSLRLGRSAQSVVGRLIRFWDSRNISKNGEFMGITILLLDELDSVIHGFIPANRANHYWF